LLPLYERDGAPQALFIKRTELVGTHKGEIGLPGGRIEPEDVSPLAAALREAEEEVGIPPADVTVLGALPRVSTFSTGMELYPFVGRLAAPPALRLSAFEVAEAIEVPLAVLLHPDTYVEEDRVLRGVPRRIFIYRHGPYDIWGVTGRIVQEFLALLAAWPGHAPGAPWSLDEVAAVLKGQPADR
jgi:8-oxo-dGTP pyrophosphatase MutT (NUDIX family)